MTRNKQLMQDKEVLQEAKEHYEFRLNAKEGETPQPQSDQSEQDEDPDDHDGEYDGWDDEEWQDEAANDNEEADEDDAVNPDTSAVDEAFCPCDAERKIKELHERNGRDKEN